MMRFVLVLMCVVLGATPCLAWARPPLPVDVSDRDASNPRNKRWAWPVIEWVGVGPRAEVRELGALPRPPETERATITIVVRNAGPGASAALVLRGLPASAGDATVPSLSPGERVERTFSLPTRDIPYGSMITLHEAGGDAQAPPLDAFNLHGPAAHRVALVATEASWKDGDERFGSMARRFRASLDDLHTLFDGLGVVGMPENGGDPSRPIIADRFRLEHIEAFDPDAGTPPLFAEHPQFDLVIALNEGGPLCCFWLSDGDSVRYHSIGHNFLNTNFGEPRGIWSNWGEQALWHEIMHYRGVPDYYIYNIPAGALPGRSADGWTLGSTPGTAHLRREIMNDTYTAPEFSWLTAFIAASKKGSSRVGACENPLQPFGHMWTWIPARVVAMPVGTDAATIEAVRVFRSAPGEGRDARVQRIGADAQPIASAAIGAAAGPLVLEGDFMNGSAARHERALWLLVEADAETASGIETRWTILTLLELNEAWARGSKDEWRFAPAWESMQPIE